ncbi:hypothetical protein CYY_009605 [Polysphondylium violaceum]|uniref:Uncharacterized protein n=1 Tax=Polysphondylium violaceum TaxID=133409 RepID=A0A8J4V0D6_9MYCE|nr:hypothetical protein CYY_009605 [Polysphondylium violaceum]
MNNDLDEDMIRWRSFVEEMDRFINPANTDQQLYQRLGFVRTWITNLRDENNELKARIKKLEDLVASLVQQQQSQQVPNRDLTDSHTQ